MARSYMRARKDSSGGVALADANESVGADRAREKKMEFKRGYPVKAFYSF
jgi:hypothetical protein